MSLDRERGILDDPFTGVTLDPIWTVTPSSRSNLVTVAASAVTLASSNDANGATALYARRGALRPPFKLNATLSLSQRIINQSFLIDIVSLDENLIAPDERWSASILFSNTTATNAVYRVQEFGEAAYDSSAQTITTTAAAGATFEIEARKNEIVFRHAPLTSGAWSDNYVVRLKSLPADHWYVPRLRWINGATPPVSSTNAIVDTLRFYTT